MNEQEDHSREAGRLARSERMLMRAIAALTALLLLSQLALHFPEARQLLTRTEHWEGTRYPGR